MKHSFIGAAVLLCSLSASAQEPENEPGLSPEREQELIRPLMESPEVTDLAEQMTKLQLMDCKYAQGYLFSRPVPADDATALVRHGLQRDRVA